MKSRSEKNSKKSFSKKKKILLGVFGTLLSLILVLTVGYLYVREKIYDSGKNTETGAKIQEFEETPGVTNVLLIGTDARKLDEKSRGDSIMILTIDNNNKKLKLTSIMRDTVVDIEGANEQKINAALSIGGPKLLLDTINSNFNMKLDKYIMVNFWGFEDIINELGGIDVDIKDYEIKEMNKFIGEYHEKKSPKIENPGMQKLDGQQALAYARIRKVGNGDYERTDRQRRVISIAAQKFKDVSIFEYPKYMDKILPNIKTNIEPYMLINYAYTASKFPSLDFEQLRIPASELISWGGYYKNLGWALLVDKEQCSEAINDFIYNNAKIEDSRFNEAIWKEKLNQKRYGTTHEERDEHEIEQEKPSIPIKPPTGNGNNQKPSTGNKPNINEGTEPNGGEKPDTKPNEEKPNLEKPDTSKPETEKPDGGAKPEGDQNPDKPNGEKPGI